MNINIYTAEKLYHNGFTYQHYQTHYYKSMVFYHNGADYVIGGNCNSNIDEYDLDIIKNSVWLPSEIHLIEWLMENNFYFSIIHDGPDMGVTVHCEDSITGTIYSPTISPLAEALACLIIKILKKAERPFDTKEKILGIIDE